MKFSKKLKSFFLTTITFLVLAFTFSSCDTLMEDLESVSMYAQYYNLKKGFDYALHKYTIKHYFQNINDDEYTLQYTEYKNGTLGEQTKAVAKDSEGFTSQSFEQKTIEEDTIVEIYYTRNKYTLSYTDNLDGEDRSVPSSAEYKYGAIVNVNFTDIDQLENFKYWNTKPDGTGTTYKSDGTTSFSMPDKDVTLYAMWKGVASYTVRYFKQNLEDDDYLVDPDEEETLHGKVGFTTAAVIKSFEGFTCTAASAAAVQKTIEEDGSTVVDIYYNRNKHNITYNKNCSDAVTIPTSETSVKYGKTIDVDFTVSSRLGYTFAGWNTASDGSGTAYTQGTLESFVLGDADVTLYAQWIPTTVDGNGITISFPTISTTTETLSIAITEEKAGSSTPWNISSGPITLDAGTSIKFAISPTGIYDKYYWIWDGTPSLETGTPNSKTFVSTNFTIGTHNLIIYLENSTTHESAMGQVTFIVAE